MQETLSACSNIQLNINLHSKLQKVSVKCNMMLAKFRIIGYLLALCARSCLSNSERPMIEKMIVHPQFVRKLTPKPSEMHEIVIAVKQKNMVNVVPL